MVAPCLLAADRSHVLHPAVEMSLFAREPDVVDPVALTFDAVGRVYVVEMRDYPYGFGAERRPGGTIRLLEDIDGDGRVDRAILFADNLSFPTSVTPWNEGILVAAPPDILFLKDVDGDGRADVREVILTGFHLGVTDSNLNGLRWGLDGWVHAGNGGNGGRIRSPKRPDVPALELRDRDFRFRPETAEVQLTMHTGGGFGLVFDDWGRSFTTYNINHIQQRVANADFFTRVPGMAPIETTHSISDHGEMARIFPISVAQTRPNHPEQAGHFSAAGGMGIIADQRWPAELIHSVLVCDVVGNLVHRDVLVPDGPIFRATRAVGEQDKEFLAGRDPAFRPVGLEPGPDGALYLIDMQREVIEHPDYIPSKLLEKLDVRAGDDRGRLYRIAPRQWKEPRELPGKSATAELPAFLASPNPWTRATAQRLLLERRDETVLSQLKTMATGHGSPHARLHALCVLDAWGKLDDPILEKALKDPMPGVRENAVARVGHRVALSSRWMAHLVAATADSEVTVRFQAALALGNARGESEFREALVGVLRRDYRHAWSRRAVSSALTTQQEAVLERLLRDPEFLASPDGARWETVEELSALVGARHRTTGRGLTGILERSADSSLPEEARMALLRGGYAGLERSAEAPEVTAEARTAVSRCLAASSPRIMAASWRLARRLGMPDPPEATEWLERAGREVMDPAQPLPRRLEYLELLSVGDFKRTGRVLFSLLNGLHPVALQQASLSVLRPHREPEIAVGLIDNWRSLAPGLRSEVVQWLVYRRPFQPALLDALENGKLQIGELNLDLEHRRELLRKAPSAIRVRAAKWMSDEEYSNRKAVVDQWLGRLPAIGDRRQGRSVFLRLCSPCHRSGDLGHEVGPNLTKMSHRSVEDLLSNILDPNMAMNPTFAAYTAELIGDEEETGILAAENTEVVTLLQAQGRRIEIPRSRIQRLQSNGRSLMPEGLESGLTPQDLRDVIAFVQEGDL
ncbi:MAG: c-type cytochrome [Verrucomicrobiales bacterium]|nr:c-type cytochrome [Verrucomicrobiales bacterium]